MEGALKLINKEKERAQSVIGGTLSLTLSTVIVKLLGVTYKIPLAHILGEEGMGYFNSAYTVYAFFYLLCTAGVPKAIMILISDARARTEKYEPERIVGIAMRLFIILGLSVTTLFILFSAPLASLIGSDKSRLTMIAIAPSIVFISLAGVIRGYLSADMRFLTIASSQITEGVGKLALGLIFAVMGGRMGLPLSIISAMTILGVTFGALFGFMHLALAAKIKRVKGKSNSVRGSEIIRRIFAISIPITISAAIMSVTNIIDLSLIMKRLIAIGYSEEEATALYGNYTTLAVPMFNLAISVITPVSIAFLPVFTRAKAKEDSLLRDKSLKSSLELSGFISAPIMAVMMLYSKEILTLLFGDIGVKTGAPLLSLLSPAIFFMSILLILNSLLESMGAVKAPMISMTVGSIGKIIVSAVLLSNPDFGISGAPIGTLVSYVLALISSLIIAKFKCKIRVPIFSTYLNSCFSAFVSVFLSRLLFLRLLEKIEPTPAFLLSLLSVALLYILLSLALGTVGKKKLEEIAKYTKHA